MCQNLNTPLPATLTDILNEKILLAGVITACSAYAVPDTWSMGAARDLLNTASVTDPVIA
ncbi:hypothetical protein N6Y36_12220 [Morganella morganii]|nr:hypothetical protein N6Y36_12220 [Morganella morganii]